MREPLLAPFVAVAVGVLLARWTDFQTTEVFLAALAFALLAAIAHAAHSRSLAIVCCSLAFTAAGSFLAISHRPPAPPELTTDDRETVILSGCVVEPGFLAHEKEQFTLELEPGARMRVSMFLREGQAPPDLTYGQRVEFLGRTRQPRNYRNPGDFDNVAFLARQHIYWTASIPAGEHVHTLPGECGSRFWAWIYGMRVAALERLESLYEGSPYTIAMMQATLIGESAGLDKVWTEDFRNTGTFHALVISGAHVAVLAAALFFFLRLCWVPRLWAGVITAAAAWIYACVTGWQEPAVRSAAALTMFALGRCFYRRGRIVNVLAATGLLFLILDPAQLFEAGFQLSFGAVALIGLIGSPLLESTAGVVIEAMKDFDRQRLPERIRAAQVRVELKLVFDTIRLVAPWYPSRLFIGTIRIGIYFYEIVVTSAVIQIGLALPMALYFHRISFSGLSANAIIVPLLCLAVPLGFAAILLNNTHTAWVAGELLEISRRAAAWHAQREPNWRIPDPPLWLSLAFVAALVWAAWRWKQPGMRWPGAIAAVAVLAVMVRYPFPPRLTPHTLELTAIDVGQGDSLLVGLPDGRLMLVDAGGIPSFGVHPAKPRIDIGEDVISPYLWNRGIRRLDIVAMTHAHTDHSGGIPAILENFRPREIWTGAVPTGPEWEPIRQKALALHIPVRRMNRGDRFEYGEVLAPWPGQESGKMAKNNDSLVLLLHFGRNSFLLTGDAEKQVERAILDGNIHADVLKVGHHGSKTSSTEAFLDAVHPAFGIISDGFDNTYGHPSPPTLEHLAARNIEILRTDQLGPVTIRSDSRHLDVKYR